MKLDMHLVQKILTEIENLPFGIADLFQPEVEGYSSEEVSYHLMVLIKDGLIEGEETPDGWYASALTLKGDEVLKQFTSETIALPTRRIGFV
jgi:hypothetical protein